jgi:hypothetical protein
MPTSLTNYYTNTHKTSHSSTASDIQCTIIGKQATTAAIISGHTISQRSCLHYRNMAKRCHTQLCTRHI